MPVPRKEVFVATLMLGLVLPFSRHAYTWLLEISATKQINVNGRLDGLENSRDPQVLLAEANHFYWVNNGPKAGPLYAKAESLFASRGDARNELYAKIGHFRSEAETMSFVDLSRFLNDQLQNPIMRNDPRLRLWCLAAKGYTDIEIDYQAEKQDWLEAQQIAKSLGDDRWATRASGELGIIAFLEGNTGQGAKMKELIARGDLQRRLVVCPGSLAEQWQDELSRRFHLPFDILTNDKLEAARTGNWSIWAAIPKFPRFRRMMSYWSPGAYKLALSCACETSPTPKVCP